MVISPDLLKKYNLQGPRYTSYPPATSFHQGFGSEEYLVAIDESNSKNPRNISIYIHIPFCPQRCFFCGCNTTTYRDEGTVKRYVDSVKKEISLVAQRIDSDRLVTQIHWGGGTPNSIPTGFIEDVMGLLKGLFTLADSCEIAIECSPAYLDLSYIDALARMGFNRISLGVQDFNPDVLSAINRKPPLVCLSDTIGYLRANGFRGVNLDLVYGLPFQTVDSFRDTISRALDLRPDRLVTFSYAHVPWFNSEQKRLESLPMANPQEKLTMLVYAINTLTEMGYRAIGMDHFALPTDDLATARANRSLHRNFQGYCTRATTGQVYAFGASAISQLEGCYAQNVKEVDRYIDSIEGKGIAVERGYSLTANERIIRSVINELMCNGYIDFAAIAQDYNLSADEVKAITGFEPSKIASFVEDGLVQTSDDSLRVSEVGMMVVRSIAMAFDPQFAPSQNKHSQTI